MATKERKKVPKVSRQQIWNYLRRNRSEAKVSDIQILTGIGIDRIRRYLTALHRAGYIREVVPATLYKEKSFALIRYTGVIAPVANYNDGEVTDHNTGETISIKREPVFQKVRKKILQLHENNEEIRLSNLLECGGRTTVKRELERLTKDGIIRVKTKGWRGFVYEANIEALQKAIKKRGEEK